MTGVAGDTTPEEWIALGTRVHGEFGPLIALGIRIGLDARVRLDAGPRRLVVAYQSGPGVSRACVMDGIAIATVSSLGQGTAHVLEPGTNPATFGTATVRDPSSGAGLMYTIPSSAGKLLAELYGQQTSPRQRYDTIMGMPQDELFTVEPLPS